MLLWFTDLIDVTEEVTIRRPNVSTYLPFLEWVKVGHKDLQAKLHPTKG